jgi:nitrite reductase/ring-hydroxylating ferredoxin subunit/uncharacterized membrane protein
MERSTSQAPLAYRMVTAIEETESIDAASRVIEEQLDRVLGSVRTREILSGTWLGHSLHPLMTDVPLGAWMSASMLDLLGPRRFARAADVLVAIGLAASVPTVVTGWAEWLDAPRSTRRAGIVHALANNVAIGMYAGSLVARMRGRRAKGVALAVAGGIAAGVGGYIGAHMSFARGAGVDRTAFVEVPDTWSEVETDTDGRPVRMTAEGVDVLLVSDAGQVRGVVATCTRCGATLLPSPDRTARCEQCASRYRVTDGAVLRGPATVPARGVEVSRGEDVVALRPRGVARTG